MQIPLVVALWERTGFQGRKRTLVEDAPHLGWMAFDDRTHSIGVHPGPDYYAWRAQNGGREPFVRAYEHPHYGGRYLELFASADPDPFEVRSGMSGITSVRFNTLLGGDENELGSVYDVTFPDVPQQPRKVGSAHRIASVPLVVELYDAEDFNGDFIVVVEDEADLGAAFGWDDRTTSVRVRPGSWWNGEEVCLYEGRGFTGRELRLKVGGYRNLGRSKFDGIEFEFDDAVSSLRFVGGQGNPWWSKSVEPR